MRSYQIVKWKPKTCDFDSSQDTQVLCPHNWSSRTPRCFSARHPCHGAHLCCSGLFWALKIGLTIQLPITRCHGRARHIQVHVLKKYPVGTSHEFRIICITIASTKKQINHDKSFSTIVGFHFSLFLRKTVYRFLMYHQHKHHRFFPPCPEWLGWTSAAMQQCTSWTNCENTIHTQMLHGAGICTYKTHWFWG